MKFPGIVEAVSWDSDELLVDHGDARLIVGVARWLDANKRELPEAGKRAAHYAEFEFDGRTYDVLVAEHNLGMAIMGGPSRAAV